MTTVLEDKWTHRKVTRDLVSSTGSCAICGKERFHGGKPTGKMYVYMLTSLEDPALVLYKGFFCSTGCWNEYWLG